MADNPDAADNDLHSNKRDIFAIAYGNIEPYRWRPSRVHSDCNSHVKRTKDVPALGSTDHRSQLKELIPKKQLYRGPVPKDTPGDIDALPDTIYFRVPPIWSAGNLRDVTLV
jgi:hypothetical protein